jgi:hypothetical protein
MSHRRQWIVLAIVLVLLAIAYFENRNQVGSLPGVLANDTKFTPLSVQEPQLRLDELTKLQKREYSGTHRNIFTATPPPVLQVDQQSKPKPPVGDMLPQPQPILPVQVPGEFFGFAWMRNSGKRVAFFKVGEDVIVVPEGDTYMNRFRLVHIGNDSADMEQLSDGRHATVMMVQPAAMGDPVPPPSPDPSQGFNPQPDGGDLTPRR